MEADQARPAVGTYVRVRGGDDPYWRSWIVCLYHHGERRPLRVGDVLRVLASAGPDMGGLGDAHLFTVVCEDVGCLPLGCLEPALTSPSGPGECEESECEESECEESPSPGSLCGMHGRGGTRPPEDEEPECRCKSLLFGHEPGCLLAR